MRYKGLTALAVVSTLFAADAAAAQDGGIWASRPRPQRMTQESVPASALAGLAPGLPVQNSGGKPIGRVSKIVTASDGSIRKVVAISAAGNFLNLSPTSLSVANGVVTTESE
ncbi:hypothetical protein [Sphingomonas sp. URHD0057]|uniref:hypothetical protein n=1 Tax=Sphingomonas sp. URHD0057 TaxID=1380389 RepID=UPI000A889AEF|nr:hypothetical protein [Sphingomonas sp. URHD0057]